MTPLAPVEYCMPRVTTGGRRILCFSKQSPKNIFEMNECEVVLYTAIFGSAPILAKTLLPSSGVCHRIVLQRAERRLQIAQSIVSILQLPEV